MRLPDKYYIFVEESAPASELWALVGEGIGLETNLVVCEKHALRDSVVGDIPCIPRHRIGHGAKKLAPVMQRLLLVCLGLFWVPSFVIEVREMLARG